MRKLILIIYLILLALALGSIARGGPGTFPQGDHVKQLKDKIEFKNSLTQIISNDSDDPTSVAKNAAAGSVYLRTTGIPYIKLDAGSSTNWARILTTDNADANDVAYDANDNIRDKIDEFSDHGNLGGLADDDHSQYALLAGRSGGQTLTGDTAASGDLTLSSTSNGSKGEIVAQDKLNVSADIETSGSFLMDTFTMLSNSGQDLTVGVDTNTTLINGDVTVNKDLSVTTDLDVLGSYLMDGTTFITNSGPDLTIGVDANTTLLNGDVTVNKSLSVTTDATVTNDLTVSGAAYIDDERNTKPLDIYHTDNFEKTSSSTWSSGDNATFLGGGTINGTFADDTSTQLNGLQGYKFTQDANSLNSYVASTTKAIPSRSKDKMNAWKFVYSYDGNDSDFNAIVYDANSSTVLATKALDAATAKREAVQYFPVSTTDDVRYGFQVGTVNSGKNLLWDDMELTDDPFVYKELVETQVYRVEQAGNALTDRAAPSIEFNLGTATITNTGTDLITAVDNPGNTETRFTANRNGITVDIHAVIASSAAGNGSTIDKNGTRVKLGGLVSTVGYHAIVSGSLELDEGDYFTVGCTAGAQNNAAIAYLSFNAQATTEHVVVPAEAGTEYFSTSRNANFWDFAGAEKEFDVSLLLDNDGNSISTSDYLEITNVSSTERITAKEAITLIVYAEGIAAAGSQLVLNNSSDEVIAGDDDATAGYQLTVSKTLNLEKDDYVYLSASNLSNTSGLMSLTARPQRVNLLAAIPVQQVAYIKDVKANNTAGGTFTSGAWQTRTLNTLEGDTGFVSLSSNQFTLSAGKYLVEAEAPAFDVSQHKAKLRNTSDSTDDILGTSEYASTGDISANNSSFVRGQIEITASKVFEIQHQCTTTRATNGFGVPANYSVSEIYTVVKITKLE